LSARDSFINKVIHKPKRGRVDRSGDRHGFFSWARWTRRTPPKDVMDFLTMGIAIFTSACLSGASTTYKLQSMATKDDLKTMATKEDFKDMVTKEDLKEMVTKEDLKNLVTKDDFKDMVTKDDLKNIATKDDIMDILDVMRAMIDRFVALEGKVRGKVIDDQIENGKLHMHRDGAALVSRDPVLPAKSNSSEVIAPLGKGHDHAGLVEVELRRGDTARQAIVASVLRARIGFAAE
jgi:hypothetical protein